MQVNESTITSSKMEIGTAFLEIPKNMHKLNVIHLRRT
jgi:hypothetical protein